MAWLMDTYSMNVGYSVPGVTTGKPIVLDPRGGTRLRARLRFTIESTARILDLIWQRRVRWCKDLAMPGRSPRG